MFGAVEVRVGGRRQDVGHARQRAVLAVLLVEAGHPVPVDALVDRVWGERAPSRARSVLRTYLARLRPALAPGGITITHRSDGYLLDVDRDAVDLHRFRRLVAEARGTRDPARALVVFGQALELWRAEPLAESDTPWAEAERRRLHRERAVAEADRADRALDCGRHHELLPELTARAEADPLDERVAAQLMTALYRAGRQADALHHYQRTRHHLAEELGADPGPALRELHRRMLAADSALDLAAPGTRAGTPVVPRQLPAAPRSFTGRTAQLAALDAALADGGLHTIGGAGGMGKTWLALAWADRDLDRFPDGQLFVDLRGFDPTGQPVGPAEATRVLLTGLGADVDGLPSDPDELTARYRGLVAGRRLLVVLDNAATAAQVVPLLPGSTSCTVLVTGRAILPSLIDRHGARHLHLDVLTHDEAHALLTARAGAPRVAAEPGAVDELIESCGRHPLALSIIARQAATRPGVPLGEFAAELREAGLEVLDHDTDPTASLPAVLSWSLHHLGEAQRTLFALLGIAPGPDVDTLAAVALAGLPAARTRRDLRALADASLLDRQAGGRYAMHDLVRAYAATTADDLLPAPARRAALDRVVDFYLHTAHAADRVLDPHRDPVDVGPPAPDVRPLSVSTAAEAMHWFDAEHRHLLDAQRVAAAQGRHHAVWHLAWASSGFHARRGLAGDDLAAWQAAVTAAPHLSDPGAVGLAHRRVGRALAGLGRHEEATGHLGHALAAAEHHGDLAQQADAHGMLALAWALRGDHRRALVHTDRSLHFYRLLDRPVGQARALGDLGWFSALLGDLDGGRGHLVAALDLLGRHPDPATEAAVLDSLGYVDHTAGRHAESVAHYRRAAALYEELDYTAEHATTLDNLGRPLCALGRFAEARAVWSDAAERFRAQDREADADRVRRRIGELVADGGPGS
ncbi:BTAD domain-containing putative transcriptional regulator [Saccharothrix violaceirubra]